MAIACASRWRFPNTYWVGMSNLGFQTVYRLFNDAGRRRLRARVSAAEAGSWPSSSASSAPLVDARVADAGRRLRRLRVLGLVRVGLRQRASRCCASPAIPIYAAERTERHPLIVIGGAVTFVNPEPLALFADVIAAGEGEVLVPGLERAFAAATDRRDLLRACSRRARFLHPIVLRAALRRRRHASAGYTTSVCSRTRRCRCARRR